LYCWKNANHSRVRARGARIVTFIGWAETESAILEVPARGGWMPSAISLRQDAQQYLVIAPDGNQIQISRELFSALWEFLQGDKPTGSIVIHFRNGGIAGLEAIVKKVYK
jgi:hypothetical protein